MPTGLSQLFLIRATLEGDTRMLPPRRKPRRTGAWWQWATDRWNHTPGYLKWLGGILLGTTTSYLMPWRSLPLHTLLPGRGVGIAATCSRATQSRQRFTALHRDSPPASHCRHHTRAPSARPRRLSPARTGDQARADPVFHP